MTDFYDGALDGLTGQSRRKTGLKYTSGYEQGSLLRMVALGESTTPASLGSELAIQEGERVPVLDLSKAWPTATLLPLTKEELEKVTVLDLPEFGVSLYNEAVRLMRLVAELALDFTNRGDGEVARRVLRLLPMGAQEVREVVEASEAVAHSKAVSLRHAMASLACDLERKNSRSIASEIVAVLRTTTDGIDGPQGTTVLKRNQRWGGTGAYMAAQGHNFVAADDDD